jgi:hypothetical protein
MYPRRQIDLHLVWQTSQKEKLEMALAHTVTRLAANKGSKILLVASVALALASCGKSDDETTHKDLGES